MIGLLQRVSCASVRVDGSAVARIDRGLLVLVGVQQGDDAAQALRLARRLLDYRVFPDDRGRMNRSVRDIGGGMILVPQFTLAADTRSGSRASFTTAAEPGLAGALFEQLLEACRAQLPATQSGVFGADMQVALVNDGPVSFVLSCAQSA